MPKPDRGRHQARKRAVDLLFEAEARGITPAEAAESREALAQKQTDVSALNPYTVTVAKGVTQHAAHIDDLISTHLQGWTLERLPAVDRAILRVAVWELLHARFPNRSPSTRPSNWRSICQRMIRRGSSTACWVS